MRNKQQAVWFSKDTIEDSLYLAVFNLSDEVRRIVVNADELELESFTGWKMEELWNGDKIEGLTNNFETEVPVHGVKLYKLFK